MFGGGSIQLGRIFGIRIGVDVSWFIVLFLIIWSLSGYYEDVSPGSSAFLLATVSALLFFLSILLHELGHALVAVRNGIPILGIDLWMFGGVAKLGKDSDSPGVEFRVAVAGPIVTLVIALACYLAGSAVSSSTAVIDSSRFEDTTAGATTAVLGYLLSINVLVLLFNLIPGFPLDGGRIARAVAWKLTGDRNKATRFAALLGRGFGWLLVAGGAALFIFGIDTVGGVWFAFIGFFLAQAARSATEQANFSDRIGDIRVSDVMDTEPVAIPQTLTVDEADARLLPALRLALVPGGGPLRPARGRGVAGGARQRSWNGARNAPGGHGDGARRRLERPARPARGSARDAAHPGVAVAARRGDGRGRRRRAARDRHDRGRPPGAAGRRAGVSTRFP